MSNKKVVWIVDFNHLLHKFSNAMRSVGLSAEVEVPRVDSLTGATFYEKIVVDTGTVSALLKYLVNNISCRGYNPMIICADSSNKSRKAYFKQEIAKGNIYSSDGGYKESRSYTNREWIKNGSAVLTILEKSGAVILKENNYEADDIILDAVRVAKRDFPDLPICILANDLDLAPLIDERVSLYKYPTKLASSEDGFPLLGGYTQITPRNYQEVLEGTVIVKSLGVGAVYNSLLLTKILRGDKSDNISCMSSFKGRKGLTRLRELLSNASQYEPDFVDIFRYYPWVINLEYNGRLYENIPDDVSATSIKSFLVSQGVSNVDLAKCKLVIEPPQKEIDRMCEVLNKYGLGELEIKEFVTRYHGMNLNGAFLEMDDNSLRRRPYRIKNGLNFDRFDYQLAKLEASKLQIHL